MTNEQILKKEIKKAVENGFDDSRFWDDYYKEGGDSFQPLNYEYQVIFSHDFAKAFWGDKNVLEVAEKIMGKYAKMSGIRDIPIWKDRLQQMVLEEDPIKYLEKFLSH